MTLAVLLLLAPSVLLGQEARARDILQVLSTPLI